MQQIAKNTARNLPSAGHALLGEALAQIVHRAAGDAAVGIFVTVLHPKRALDEL